MVCLPTTRLYLDFLRGVPNRKQMASQEAFSIPWVSDRSFDVSPFKFSKVLPFCSVPYRTVPYSSLLTANFFQSCFAVLNRPVNLPCMYFSHVRYSLMTVLGIFVINFRFILVRFAPIPSVLVRFGKLWHRDDLKPGVGFWLWRPGLDPGFNSSISEPVWSTYCLLQ